VTTAFIDIVFDGPPGHESGRFVEVENDSGASINFGEWVKRDDGYWALRITMHADGLAITVARDARRSDLTTSTRTGDDSERE
jgi:hypothetical protein